MRTCVNEYNYETGRLMNGYDYINQAWVLDGRYIRCGHPETMDCHCYGKDHDGEETKDYTDLGGKLEKQWDAPIINTNYIYELERINTGLLEACERAVKTIPGIQTHGQYYEDGIIADLQQAIAKAKGGNDA